MRPFFFSLCAMVALISFADVGAIVLNPKGPDKDRSGFPLYFDMPAAYYYYDVKTQEIIIDGGGAVSYYDVEISSAPTGTLELMTSVSGTYDTFDISSLSSGSHVITITSSLGNVYEGTFTKY